MMMKKILLWIRNLIYLISSPRVRLNLDSVSGQESLYRAIKPNPDFWKSVENRPSSALFKDSFGVSVDRDGNRNEKDILTQFKTRFSNLRGVAKLKAQDCLDLKCRLVPKPKRNNIYHSLMLGETDVELKNKQARKLAKTCQFLPL